MEIWGFGQLLCVALVLRGLTAGFILGLAVMMIPMKRRVGTSAHAAYQAAMYRTRGPQIYGAATVLAVAILVLLVVWRWESHEPGGMLTLLLTSLGLTAAGLVGTPFSLRAMRLLWQSGSDHPNARHFLAQFERWHVYGACCHSLAFAALAAAAASS